MGENAEGVSNESTLVHYEQEKQDTKQKVYAVVQSQYEALFVPDIKRQLSKAQVQLKSF
jgi:hypothetical protein